jgi:hypothetical protein
MSTTGQLVPEAKAAAHSDWANGAARLGFAGRGVIYLLIGVIAVRLAVGQSNTGEEADRQGALRELADQRFGSILLIVLAIGLGGYVLWRFTEALWGYGGESDAHKRALHRISSFAKGAAYLFFLGTVIAVLRGSSSSGTSGNQQPKNWTARVLGWPGGQALVGGAGVAIVAGGLFLMYRGLTQKFEKKLETGRMSLPMEKLAKILGTVGVSARGAVFAAACVLLVKAAADYDPNKTEGIDGTLRTVARQTYGQTLLLLAGAGLVAFGLYSFVEARYRRLRT